MRDIYLKYVSNRRCSIAWLIDISHYIIQWIFGFNLSRILIIMSNISQIWAWESYPRAFFFTTPVGALFIGGTISFVWNMKRICLFHFRTKSFSVYQESYSYFAHTWWRHQMEAFFSVTGPLLGESTGYRWISLTKASDAELWCFPSSVPDQTVEQTTETPVIWDALSWRQCNEPISKNHTMSSLSASFFL